MKMQHKAALAAGLALLTCSAYASLHVGSPVSALDGGSVTVVAPMPASTSAGVTPVGMSIASTPGDYPSDPRLPISDLAYFGAGWSIIELNGPSPAFTVSGGYQNAHVTRDAQGLFFGGTVEKANANGEITDVILAFAGTQGLGDLEPWAGLILVTDSAQLRQAKAMFDAIMADPRYENTHVHLSGHSLGGAMAVWLYGYSLSRYGAAVTHDRISVSSFAAPPWGNAAMTSFGLSAADFGNHVQNYVTANDIFKPAGVWPLGVQHVMPAYEPFKDIGPANSVASLTIGHAPISVILGLKTPAWLTPAQREAALTALGAGADSGTIPNPLSDIWDRNYGANGSVAQDITGTAAGDVIFASDSADTIYGGGGADTLTGGTGGDRFVYKVGDSTASATDLIADFSGAQGDRIDLSQIPVSGLINLGRFHFVGNALPASDNEVGFTFSGNDTLVIARLGGGRPDLVIRLKGRIVLVASDFIL